MKPRWRTFIPADGHPVGIDTAGRAYVISEVAVHQFELHPIPDPPRVSKPARGRSKPSRRR